MLIASNNLGEYTQPWVETIILAPEALVCDSPLDGGLEDTEEDDFDF